MGWIYERKGVLMHIIICEPKALLRFETLYQLFLEPILHLKGAIETKDLSKNKNN